MNNTISSFLGFFSFDYFSDISFFFSSVPSRIKKYSFRIMYILHLHNKQRRRKEKKKKR